MYSETKYKQLLIFFKRHEFYIITMLFLKASLFLNFPRLKWRILFLTGLSRKRKPYIADRKGFILGNPEGLKIGKVAVIGANSAVTKSVEAILLMEAFLQNFIKRREDEKSSHYSTRKSR